MQLSPPLLEGADEVPLELPPEELLSAEDDDGPEELPLEDDDPEDEPLELDDPLELPLDDEDEPMLEPDELLEPDDEGDSQQPSPNANTSHLQLSA
jgi:hypothetical protein